MRIAVAGGTGTVGKYVVATLKEAGHEPVVLSRGHGVDLVSGDGLDAALDGVDVVIDVSNRNTPSRKKSAEFFRATTGNLLAAELKAGVKHHVALSIVGVDRVDFGYYEGKRVQEKLVREGPVPWSVLRATQFHEFPGQVLSQMPGPIALIPKMRIQPIAAWEVAQALVAIAVGTPVGMAPELAGPQEESLADLARRMLRAEGKKRAVLSMSLPVAGAREMASGGQLPTGPGPRGTQTFDEWLAER